MTSSSRTPPFRQSVYEQTYHQGRELTSPARNRSNRFPLAPEGDVSGRRKSASQTAVNQANSSKPDGRQIEAGKTADRKRKGIKDWTQLHSSGVEQRQRDTE